MTTSSLNILIDSSALQGRIVTLLEEYLIQFYRSSIQISDTNYMSNTVIDRKYVPSGDIFTEEEQNQIVVVYVNPQSRKFAEDFFSYLQQRQIVQFNRENQSAFIEQSSRDEILYIVDCRQSNITGKDVILLHNLVENENSISDSEELIRSSSPNSICSISLLCPYNLDSKSDFIGFTIPTDRIVGYGLSWKGHFQQLYHISTIS
jgi:hypoxanthine-guanine phosphoribosyltransferase